MAEALSDIRAGQPWALEALLALDEVVADDLEAIGQLGTGLARHGRVEESIDFCRALLARRPPDWRHRPTALQFIADRLVNLGRLAEAAAAYQAVVENLSQGLCTVLRRGPAA
ncbi:MAG: hypothetical protein NTW86_16005 [Candidatus Sumerlaeota bacterium]|nr:hypothetical protein [Candidatus Sumerlaeota bacterium]